MDGMSPAREGGALPTRRRKPGGGRGRVVVTNPRRRPWFVALLPWASLPIVAVALAGGFVALALYARAAATVPPVPPFEALRPGGITVVRANDGQVIGEFYEERRLDLAFEDIPAGLILAFLAAEDERFFEHSGLDVRGVARAAIANVKAGEFVEGASTITQQLAKSVLGRPEGFGSDAELSLIQKAREAIYARRLEDVYTKEQILLLYMNGIFLGHGSYGVRAAAQNYFRKDLRDLNLTEMALLAGLPQSPSRLNPVRHQERARERLTHVLGQMERNGFITPEQRDGAAAARLVVYPLGDPFRDGAPYFVREVVRELRRWSGAPKSSGKPPDDGGGRDWRSLELRVDTTADIAWHRAAEKALDQGLRDLDRKQGWRGPLVHLDEARWPDLLARIGAELRGRPPEPGALWPALVAAVDGEGVDVRLTETVGGRIPLAAMKWAGPYEEGKRPSFGRTLKDPRKALRPGDVVLVEVGAPDSKVARSDEGRLRLALAQEPQVEGAVVAMVPESGYVPVIHGGWDFDRSEMNRVRAVRQTGSAIKPAIYSLAYDLGLAPSTLLSGAPFREGDYAPTKREGKDDLIAWDALAESENNVSLRVMNYVQKNAGPDGIRRWFRLLGLDKPVQGYTAEVLGVDQTPIGLTRMMSTFAHGGRSVEARLFRRVVDHDGFVYVRPAAFQDPMNAPIDVLDALHRAVALPQPQAIPATTAHLIAANLRAVFVRGTARAEGKTLRLPAGGKTGTLPYDVWFTGFTAHAAATVWIGADRRERPLGTGGGKSRVYGANTALPAWRTFMNDALAGLPADDPVGPPPKGVTVVTIDPTTGTLGRDGEGRVVPHREGTEPTAAAPGVPQGGRGTPEVLQTEF